MMMKPEIILSQLEDALNGIDKINADQLSEDDRISIAEMIINLQMQLGMLGKAARVRLESRLKTLKAAAAEANIRWQLS